jgi:hypothetical protein
MNYYQVNFGMMQHHKYSLNELDEMFPWEREIYVGMLLNYLEEERRKREEAERR